MQQLATHKRASAAKETLGGLLTGAHYSPASSHPASPAPFNTGPDAAVVLRSPEYHRGAGHDPLSSDNSASGGGGALWCYAFVCDLKVCVPVWPGFGKQMC